MFPVNITLNNIDQLRAVMALLYPAQAPSAEPVVAPAPVAPVSERVADIVELTKCALELALDIATPPAPVVEEPPAPKAELAPIPADPVKPSAPTQPIATVEEAAAPVQTASAPSPAAQSAAPAPQASTAAEEITASQVADATTRWAIKNRAHTLATLEKFGAKRARDLRPDQYAEYMHALTGA